MVKPIAMATYKRFFFIVLIYLLNITLNRIAAYTALQVIVPVTGSTEPVKPDRESPQPGTRLEIRVIELSASNLKVVPAAYLDP